MDRLLINPSTQAALARIVTSSPHAIGLQGEKESGRKSMAMFVASKMLDTDKPEDYPYMLVVDCNEKTGIENIRETINFLKLRIPGDKKIKRCLVFLSFENLGHESQNALLKPLEEPPADTVIIITADSRRSLLPTTVSRLSWVDILPVSLSQATEYFKGEYDRGQVEKVFLVSGGKPAMTIKLLQNYEEHPLVRSISQAKDILQADRFERLAMIDKLTKEKDFDIQIFLESMSKILEAILKGRINKSGDIDRKLLASLKKMMKAKDSRRYNTNQKLLLADLFYGL
jgi:DNA polymerase III delta prime subunit